MYGLTHTQQRAQTTKTAVFNLLIATKAKVPRLVFGFAEFSHTHKHNTHTLLHSNIMSFFDFFASGGSEFCKSAI
jgi:hypothetical protein